ncbi:MAG: MFS transporter [Candidatus Methanomethylophilaceae archaeon]|nr:MFS transporter [Candidatus Methanomethylophilaceae archaeon]
MTDTENKRKNDDFVPTKASLLTLLLASMLILMGGAAVAPALPEMAHVFSDMDGILINLVITLPALAIILVGLVVGALADRLGKVKVLCISLAIFFVSGVSGYFLNDLIAVLVGRFFVGVGIAGISSCCSALISEYYHGDDRVRALGLQAAAMGIGAFVLELAGGILADFGWHYPFLIYALGLLLLMMAVVALKEPSHHHEDGSAHVDGNKGYDRTLVAYCYVAIFLAMLFMFVFPSKIPEYMEQNLGSTPTVTGLMLGVLGIFNAVTSMFHKRISESVDEMHIVTVGFLSIGVAGFVFLTQPSYASITLCALFLGVGLGLITPAVLNILASQCDRNNSGKIMGGYSTFFYLGQFVSTFVIALVISLFGGLEGNVFSAICLTGLVAALGSLALTTKVRRSR